MSRDCEPRVGVVVIGRNEGERLRRCLASLTAPGRPVIYVDSGSTDGSVALATDFGTHVVELDREVPFTAARARNAGWRRLLEVAPATDYVQFVDGDCEVDPGWLSAAADYLGDARDVVAVCGRRRERFRTASVYNRLCDLEWDTPVGPADACGGDAMFRVAALAAVDGFRDSMIAGEEPELCVRLRQSGGRIVRLDAEMTRHDAAMTRFSEWWRRAVRAGHACAEGAWLTRDLPTGLWRRDVRSAWFWAAVVPACGLVPAWWTRGASLLVFLAYAVLWLRVALRARRRWPTADAATYATFCVIAKFAHLAGILRYYANRLFDRRPALIEYKRPPTPAAAPS